MSYFVVIPAYNEEPRIGDVLKQVKKITKNIIVVDDGSKDKTSQVAERENVKVVRHCINLGKGAGMEYDPVRDRFLLWNGESEVWELAVPATKPTPSAGWAVRRVQSVGGPSGALLPSSGGANGKWKYAHGLDVFVGLREAPNGDVWIYKPTGWVDPAL